MKNKGQKSIDQKLQETVMTDKEMDRETLKKVLVREVQSIAVFVNEILSIDAAMDALADVYYERYKKFYETKNQVPDPKDVPDTLRTEDQSTGLEVDPAQIKLEI